MLFLSGFLIIIFLFSLFQWTVPAQPEGPGDPSCEPALPPDQTSRHHREPGDSWQTAPSLRPGPAVTVQS